MRCCQCPPYAAPTGKEFLYIGDSKRRWKYFPGRERLAGWDNTPREPSKIPDVILYEDSKNWLMLVEAVSRGGEINEVRYLALRDLFSSDVVERPKIVFVNAIRAMDGLRSLRPNGA